MKNQRKTKRKAFVSSVEIYCKDIKRKLGKGFIVDINENGIKLVTAADFKIGEELSLHFALPNGWKFDFFGKVIHEDAGVAAKAYGIKFLEGQVTFVLKLLL